MLKISEIRINNRIDNIVVDDMPVIGFSLESDRENVILKNAHICLAHWEMDTKDQINNRFAGELEPFTEYEVTVDAEDCLGEHATGSIKFSTGRMDTKWEADWITDLSYDFGKGETPAPMVFNKNFETEDKKIECAWINSTAMGVYEIELNGSKVGEDYFAPGFTSYNHYLQYQTYDVTDKLKTSNELLVTVAGGWAVAPYKIKRENKIYADRQALLFELRIRYVDGSLIIVKSDPSWRLTEDGPCSMAQWYDGEIYNAETDVLKSANIAWKSANKTSLRCSETLIMAQYGESVRRGEKLLPKLIRVNEEGEAIYDFGQNFAGIIEFELIGTAGQEIVFRHAEVLYQDDLFVKSLRSAKAEIRYTCREGLQKYSPRFTFMGFRYVGVKGIEPEKLTLCAYPLSSDVEEIGDFSCSNELINRLQKNIKWGGKSNFIDIPTDCPQRDERLGWTGDIAVFASTACYNFDMSRFFDKWLLDMKAEQGKGGGIPFVIPKANDGFPTMASACWGDSCILVPWAEYMARGDKGLLRRQYPVMKKYLAACEGWAKMGSIGKDRRHIWVLPYHWGDWCAPDSMIQEWYKRIKWVATAYLANSSHLVSLIAGELGETEDARYYDCLYKDVTKAYHNVLTNKKGKSKREFQSAYVLPLAFNMTEGTETEAMLDNLMELIHKNGDHLATGFPGTPYILFALSDNGREKAAYDLLLQDTAPSWLYEVKAGGTTIWERWDALSEDGTINTKDMVSGKESTDGGMVSFNHYANGAVGDWLYRRCLGLEAIEPGYKTFAFAPLIGGGLEHAEGWHKTPYGKIQASWEISGEEIIYRIDIPVNTCCKFRGAYGKAQTLNSGKHEIIERGMKA